MIDKAYIENRLIKMGYCPTFLIYFEEPYKYYHTLDHVIYLLDKLKSINLLDNDVLFLASVFHDIIYQPHTDEDSEALSAAMFTGLSRSILAKETIEAVNQIILDTKTHIASNETSAIFQILDMAILDEPLDILIDYENKIFQEYQFVDWIEYKKERIKFLKSTYKPKLDALINYIETRTPRIGVYAGSFNPFHKGHLNILEKAEKIFDKVIIAVGKNPDKQKTECELPVNIAYRQVDSYEGLLTDYLNSKSYPVTLIRGLRNSTDFQYELNQYRFLQELKPDINVTSIFCDKDFEHISSSAIRTLSKYKKHDDYIIE